MKEGLEDECTIGKKAIWKAMTYSCFVERRDGIENWNGKIFLERQVWWQTVYGVSYNAILEQKLGSSMVFLKILCHV